MGRSTEGCVMKCHICENELCSHEKKFLRGIRVFCLDCGQEGIGKIRNFELPFHEGKVDFRSDVKFPVWGLLSFAISGAFWMLTFKEACSVLYAHKCLHVFDDDQGKLVLLASMKKGLVS